MDNRAVRVGQGQVLAPFVEGEAGMETSPFVDGVARGPSRGKDDQVSPGRQPTSPWERAISAGYSGSSVRHQPSRETILESPLYNSIQSEELPSPSSISPRSRRATPLEATNSLITTDETPGSFDDGRLLVRVVQALQHQGVHDEEGLRRARERLGVEGQGNQMQSIRYNRSLELRHSLDRNVAVGDIDALGGLDAAGIGDRHIEEARLVQGIVMVGGPGVPACGQAR